MLVIRPIEFIFGNGLMGLGMTGILQGGILIAKSAAILTIAEYAFCLIGLFFEKTGIVSDSFYEKIKHISLNYGLRPYAELPSKILVQRVLAFSAIAILGHVLFAYTS